MVNISRAPHRPSFCQSFCLSAKNSFLELRISLRHPHAFTTGNRSPFRSVSRFTLPQVCRPPWLWMMQFSVIIRGRRP